MRTVTKYAAIDGTEFGTLDDCIKYEEEKGLSIRIGSLIFEQNPGGLGNIVVTYPGVNSIHIPKALVIDLAKFITNSIPSPL